jgi:hypothetical protein
MKGVKDLLLIRIMVLDSFSSRLFLPNRVGVWGGSAGGHLVALLGTSGDVDRWDAVKG